MKLEQQVVSLELAKRLKELGVKQESLFYWGKIGREKNYTIFSEQQHYDTKYMDCGIWYPNNKSISAFTVAELGEMLPVKAYGDEDLVNWSSYKQKNGRWVISLFWRFSRKNTEMIFADTEADARAKMLIYLLENKLVDTK